jgi:hypothetical protein
MSVPDSQSCPVGGVAFSWELGSPVEAFTAKNGKRWTVVELRNPQNLKQYLSIWLEGDAGPVLEAVPARTLITLRVDGVRAGKDRGELSATMTRTAVEAAFARVAGKAS